MNLGQRIRSGVKWLLVSHTSNRILEFLFGIILARLLVPADFGMVITVQVLTGFAGLVASGGMGQALIRAKEADETDFQAVFTLQLAVGCLIYLTFFLISPWFAIYFGDPLYEDLLRVSALVFLMRPFASIRHAWLARGMEFKKIAMVGVSVGLITGVASVLMAWFGLGVWSLTLAGLVSALSRNVLLAHFVPLRIRLLPSFTIMRRHSAFGFKITANDFLSYLKREVTNLIISKNAGADFLGLFNKGDSLAKIPNRLLVPPIGQTVFRAMSIVQDDLDKTKYMFYRVITLLMVYTGPLYIGLWWVAEPFIGSVYGEVWLPAAGPLEILIVAGFFFNIGIPCGVLLAAQDKLGQEMVAQVVNLLVLITATFIGLQWGLIGVAWGILFSHVFGSVIFYSLVYRTLMTRIKDLLKAVYPSLILNGILFIQLAVTHFWLGDMRENMPFAYLFVMAISGGLTYAVSFLFIPIPELKSEVERWRAKIDMVINRVRRV